MQLRYKSAMFYVMELHHIWVCTAGKTGTLLRAFGEFVNDLKWFVFHV